MYNLDKTLYPNSEYDNSTTVKIKREKPNVTWKHIWTVDESKDALLESPFSKLPIEVILQIFKNLNVNDLCNISLVCRSFKMIADQDEIWKLKSNCKFILYYSIN